MSVEALQDYTYTSKYARYLEDKKRRETWPEAVDRVRQMHIRKHSHAEEKINWAFDRVLEKRVLGSQRALQFGGKPIEKVNARIYNCCFSYCDRPRFFQEAFYLLLCGSGVGFSVQKHHVAKLPVLHKPANGGMTYLIPDSIAGWGDSLGVLIDSYTNPDSDYFGYTVEFDYANISPKGTPLSSGSGKCPGPEPLEKSLELIRKLLDNRLKFDIKCDSELNTPEVVVKNELHARITINPETVALRPIDAYDIVMYASDAVLSGGVRRSATICLFSPDDMEMAKAKTGNWFYENPQRARSNNSALLIRNKTTKEQFKNLMTWVKEYGEPGFIWSDSEECGFNPCVEIALYAYDEFGNSGWQFCNLTEINGKMIENEEDFEVAARAGAIIGTLQASYTSFPYLGEVSERITAREALLGVSITGMMENSRVMFSPDIQRKMAEIIKEVNGEFAVELGINPAARCTCIKPAGTTSCMLGTSSGVHPHHSKRYFRRVQGNNLEAPLKFFADVNPLACEKSVWSKNGHDSILTFCIEVDDKALTKEHISAINLLKFVKLTQQNWVSAGTRLERCAQPWLRHNVSNTVSVKPEEWDEVENYIYDNREFFAGISLLPSTGDLDYPQAPFCAVSTPEELVAKYGDASIFASGLIVDGLHAFDSLWVACDTLRGINKVAKPDNPNWLNKYDLKIDWVRRAEQFADRYFSGDKGRMIYCLKEVSNWKMWCDLKREWKHVDYASLTEDSDETNLIGEAACAGGACAVSF